MYYHSSSFRNGPAQKLITVEMRATSTTAVDCFSLADSQENIYMLWFVMMGEVGAPAELMEPPEARSINNTPALMWLKLDRSWALHPSAVSLSKSGNLRRLIGQIAKTAWSLWGSKQEQFEPEPSFYLNLTKLLFLNRITQELSCPAFGPVLHTWANRLAGSFFWCHAIWDLLVLPNSCWAHLPISYLQLQLVQKIQSSFP